jgi:hypothetical protein
MAALTFVGCLVIAFGPALVFLFGIVARRSQLTVFAVTAAFFELLALLLSSLIWYGMPAAFAGRAALSLVISVLLQEAARFSFVLGYGRVEEALIKASGVASLPFTDFSSAISSGFGFGLLVALVTYGDVLVACVWPPPPRTSNAAAAVQEPGRGGLFHSQVRRLCVLPTRPSRGRRQQAALTPVAAARPPRCSSCRPSAPWRCSSCTSRS